MLRTKNLSPQFKRCFEQRFELDLWVGFDLRTELGRGVDQTQQVLLQKLVDGLGDGRFADRLLLVLLGKPFRSAGCVPYPTPS